MSFTATDLVALLELEPIEHNIYRGQNRDIGTGRIFGGQVLAQALVAASHTVEEDRPIHSMHGYFILAGDLDVPVVYFVDRLRDGGSFTTRRVTGIQHGRAIFTMSASFHRRRGGLLAPDRHARGPRSREAEARAGRHPRTGRRDPSGRAPPPHPGPPIGLPVPRRGRPLRCDARGAETGVLGARHRPGRREPRASQRPAGLRVRLRAPGLRPPAPRHDHPRPRT